MSFSGNSVQKLEFSVVVVGGRRSETEPDRLCLVDWLQCVEKESAQECARVQQCVCE